VRVQPRQGPRVAVEPLAVRAGAAPDQWLVTWQIQNLGDQPLQLLAAWLPHGRFRAAERELAPCPHLPAGESTRLELPVRCAEPPDTIVENAFLILRVSWGDERWRILARLEVHFDTSSLPRVRCVLLTTQPVGFSGQPEAGGPAP
jgi:hypothetical protein